MKDKVLFLLIGLLFGLPLGWITVPQYRAEGIDNTYKGLIRQMIAIISRIEVSSAQTAEDIHAVREKIAK